MSANEPSTYVYHGNAQTGQRVAIGPFPPNAGAVVAFNHLLRNLKWRPALYQLEPGGRPSIPW